MGMSRGSLTAKAGAEHGLIQAPPWNIGVALSGRRPLGQITPSRLAGLAQAGQRRSTGRRGITAGSSSLIAR